MSMTQATLRHATSTKPYNGVREQIFTVAYYCGSARIEIVEIFARSREAAARKYSKKNRVRLGDKQMRGRGCWWSVTERGTKLSGGWVWVS